MKKDVIFYLEQSLWDLELALRVGNGSELAPLTQEDEERLNNRKKLIETLKNAR